MDEDTKVFYFFFAFQRDEGTGTILKDIYVYFIINTFCYVLNITKLDF